MSILLEYKWIILIACESLSWLTTIMASILVITNKITPKRSLKISGWVISIVAAISGWVPHTSYAIFEAYTQRHMTGFLWFLVGIVIFGLSYGFTYFKKHLKLLDLYIEKKVRRQAE